MIKVKAQLGIANNEVMVVIDPADRRPIPIPIPQAPLPALHGSTFYTDPSVWAFLETLGGALGSAVLVNTVFFVPKSATNRLLELPLPTGYILRAMDDEDFRDLRGRLREKVWQAIQKQVALGESLLRVQLLPRGLFPLEFGHRQWLNQ